MSRDPFRVSPDAGRATQADDPDMETGQAVIRLELTLAGDSLTGRASDEHGTTREFDGRLGLLAAIDELVADPGPDAPGESP
jgi:hypothetical protein